MVGSVSLYLRKCLVSCYHLETRKKLGELAFFAFILSEGQAMVLILGCKYIFCCVQKEPSGLQRGENDRARLLGQRNFCTVISLADTESTSGSQQTQQTL